MEYLGYYQMKKLFMNNTKLIFCLMGILFISFNMANAAVNWEEINWEEFKEPIDLEQLSTFPYSDCFSKAAEEYNVPILLLLSVAKGESNFNPKAIGKMKDGTPVAHGIMQIKWPGTANDLGITKKNDLYDPCISIKAGARYLAWLLKRYKGDLSLSIAAYFCGPGNVKNGVARSDGVDYSKYIYSKLVRIRNTSYKSYTYCNIFRYDDFVHAVNFIEYIVSQDDKLSLEVKKNLFSEYVISIAAGDTKEISNQKRRVEEITGLKLQCKQE